MANPGQYPMGGPMQPGGPPMGPMGQMGMMPRRPVRQGTSRMVPVVVSAGLAIGVFCGLLFGLGTGKRSASAEPPKATNGAKPPDDYTPGSLANPNVKLPDKNAPKAGSGSAVAATGSGSGTDTAAPARKAFKLTVEIKPDSAAQIAKVFLDDKEIAGTTTEIALDPGVTKKKVKVAVKAPGYTEGLQEVEVDEDVSVQFELAKGGRPAQAQTGSKDGPPATSPTKDGGAATKDTGTKDTGTKDTGKGTGTKGTGKGSGKTGKGSGGLIDI